MGASAVDTSATVASAVAVLAAATVATAMGLRAIGRLLTRRAVTHDLHVHSLHIRASCRSVPDHARTGRARAQRPTRPDVARRASLPGPARTMQPFLDACRPALTFDPEDLGAQHAVVAAADGEVVGFHTLRGTRPEGELGNLWVEPRHIRSGVGRHLWEHAINAATSIGLTAVLIDVDPHAEGYYLAIGAKRICTIASTAIPGRLLPRLRYSFS